MGLFKETLLLLFVGETNPEPPIAPERNKKGTKRKRISQETIVNTGRSRLVSLTKISCGHLLKRYIIITIQYRQTFSFNLSLESGVATAYHVSPNHPVFNILLPSTNFLHIFFHYI